ncbi:intein [Murinocardiopsis flavida]|uniref:Intein n=1 Tax=Murinocardiopsis flavida TaxID=645275 RepID=A0A2P8DHT7_9ACTN|nr:polymorphic toxin-type HINT domain-containing protein [Murinocardiopsis flavida]PSK96775.1 intein [Murinocardiopsis flavida]
MRWVWRGESGAGAIEYGALVVLAGVIVAALIGAGLPTAVTPAVSAAVCELYTAEHCKPENGGPGDSTDPDGGNGDPDGGNGDPDGGNGDPDGGTGDPDGGNGDPGGEPEEAGADPALDKEIEDAQKEYDELKKEHDKQEREAGNIDKELMDLLKELIGWNDAKKCFTEGDILACLETALTAIPWGKALKFVSKIPKAYKLFDKWRKGSKAYDKIKGQLDKQKKKLDDLKKKKKEKEKDKTSCPLPNADNRNTPNSFLPGTPVLLADGSTLPIADIEVGDRVYAFDPRTGEEGPRPVAGLIKGTGKKTLVTLTVTDAEGATGSVTATAEHPFWVPGSAQWVDAADLDPGTTLRTSSGAWARVTGTDVREVADQRVHNLDVAGIDTYFVSPADSAVLVHNDDCQPAQFDDVGEKYVKDKHVEGGKNVTPDKSVFGKDQDLDDLVEKANKVEAKGPNKDGNYERDVDAGRIIGRKSQESGGASTTRYRVVQDKYGAVITMHPL